MVQSKSQQRKRTLYEEFADEFRKIFRQPGLKTPASKLLYAFIDARYAAWMEKAS